MGGSSQANYPAPVLAGLFNGANQDFSMSPNVANADWGAAQNNTNNLTTGLGGSPYGFNPWTTGAQGNNISQAGQSALPLGMDLFNNRIAPFAQQSYNAGATEAGSLFPYVSRALQQGFDPQHALHDKLFQQQQDQTRVENAASGVATTPYGAGLATQGDQNFDISWQQAQLANQAQGANTAGGLVGAGMGALGSGAGTAANLYGTGLGGIEGLLGAAAGAGTAGANLSYMPTQLQNQNIQQQLSDYMNLINEQNNAASQYFGAANNSFGTTNNLFGTQTQQNIANQQQNANALGGIGSLLGTFGGYGLNRFL